MKKSNTKAPQPKSPVQATLPVVAWLGALALIAVATIASLMLSLKHIWAIDLIGCGRGGGCDEVIRGSWGILLGWPVAFVGLAYFAGWFVFCLMSRQSSTPSWLRLIASLGSLVSLFYIAIMIVDGHYCVWCFTAHVANLLFTLLLWMNWRFSSAPVPRLPLVTAALIGVLLLAASRLTYATRSQAATAREAASAAESIANISAPTEQSRIFGGRFWSGAVNADVRVVVFHDYQCELCHEVEVQLLSLLNSRTDVALSYKQWPFDASCNEQMHGSSPHPEACLAAKAVEAAGILGGARAYWSMHNALMRANSMTQEYIINLAVQSGLDRVAFAATMQSPQVDSLIQSDIAEGVAYGLTYTPLIFVNGYPVRGWRTAGALPEAINRAALFAKQQPKAADLPDSAAYEQLAIWQSTQPTATLPEVDRPALLGPGNATNTIVMFGDLTCPFNAAAMNVLRPIIESRTDTRLLFYHFPLDLDCNPLLKQQINQFACEATRIVEGIRLQKGDDAYKQACLWVIANRERIGASAMAELGQLFGLDAPAVAALLSSDQTAALLKKDMDRAVALNITTSPTIYINGKLVPNWRIPGLFPKILDAARIKP